MKEIQIFHHEMFGDIRTMTDEQGETWFVGKDVAEALGYKNPSNALQVHVDEEDKTTYLIQVSGLRQLVGYNHIRNLRMWFLIFTSFFIAIFIAAFLVYALELFLRW